MPSPEAIAAAQEEAVEAVQGPRGLAWNQAKGAVGIVAPILAAPYEAELAALREERDALRTWLRGHSRHSRSCDFFKGLVGGRSNEPCTCGLDALLAPQPAPMTEAE